MRACPAVGTDQLSTAAVSLSQERAVHVARELADAVLNAVRRFPNRGAVLWNREPGAKTDEEELQVLAWVPLPWLVREKAVGKKLQAHVLHSPVLSLLHHRKPEVVSILREKGAWWATLATHLRHFLECWSDNLRSLPPMLRERVEVPCSLQKRGVVEKLLREGYACPCQVEVSLPIYPDGITYDDSGPAEALTKSILGSLKGRALPVYTLGADLGVHAAMRRCRAAGELGLLRWVQAQPCFDVCMDAAGKWSVAAANHVTSSSRKLPEELVNGGDPAANSGCGSGAPSSDDDGVGTYGSIASLKILRKSSGVIAVYKPAGCSTERALAQLRSQMADAGDCEPIISVSRLDRDTSGVLIAALGQGPSFSLR